MIPLKLALLWHQHQPLYRSPRSGRYSLPWARLHGLKDYYDMAALAGEFPRLRLTFNLVPSLLDQIEDYAAGSAVDPALDLARRSADDLGEDERLALLDLYFSVPYRTLIAPYPRYAALFHKRGRRGPDGDYRDAIPKFRADDLRDLQVWFHLAWCGSTLRAREPVRELLRKADGFTEQDKHALLDLQEAFMAEIVPAHRRLAEAGIAEIATSPYYHPILPLLCDLDSAREAIPGLPLPGRSFRHPEDAAHQIASALESARRRFGSRPEGMWPSEGSLSERALQLMGEQGVRWTASDENVLRASLRERAGDPDLALRPWRIDRAGGASPVVFFRDQELSDRIGFVYSTWPARAAADDFVGRLRAIAARAPGGVVSVILDGENAWEHYPDNGVEFLSALYAGLTGADEIETVTFSQAAASGPEPGLLPSLRAGSWIGASFTTWIGHPEKNRAWELLTDAREEAARRLGPELSAASVRTLLSAAEGSDWFWWFGEDHFSEQDAIFDAAFRDLLRGVYERLQAPVPADLDQPIKQGRAATWRPPSGPVRPTLDGAVTDYFEWLAAGTCEAASGEGTMHYASGLIRRVLFGVADGSLFVRVDPERGDIRALLGSFEGASLNVVIHAPASESIRFRLEDGRVTHAGSTRAVRYAARQVLELEIPLAELPARTPPAPVPGASPGDPPVVFHVRLDASAGMVQRLPRDGTIAVPAGDLYDWSA